MTQICGDRFILIGDAARFVDPIFSTGRQHRTQQRPFRQPRYHRGRGGRRLQQVAFRYLRVDDPARHQQLVRVHHVVLPAERAVHRASSNDPEHRLDVLRLLQGDVYDDDEPAVLARMRKIVTTVEQDEKHGLHKLLGELTGDAFRPAF